MTGISMGRAAPFDCAQGRVLAPRSPAIDNRKALFNAGLKSACENSIPNSVVEHEVRKSNPEGVESQLAQHGAKRSPGASGKKIVSPVGAAQFSHTP